MRIGTEILPEPENRGFRIPQGHTWVLTDDGEGVSESLARMLKTHGEHVAMLSLAEEMTAQHITSALDTIVENQGPVGGFVHIHPPRKEPNSIGDMFDTADCHLAKSVFLTATWLDKAFSKIPSENSNRRPCFLTVTRLDGRLGLGERRPFPVIPGAFSGLTKSLAREWSETFCRHLDIAPDTDVQSAATMIFDEISDPNPQVLEIGRKADGTRVGLTYEPHAYERGEHTAPDHHFVFLVTGGARGITAECVSEIAKAFKCKFILTGRTRLAAEEPEWAADCHDEAALKSGAISHLRKESEKPTPVNVRNMVHAVLSAREIQHTLSRIQEHGGDAVYISSDITDAEAFSAALNAAEQQFGKPDGIIHGAGNLADKWIRDKTDADFSRVFDTKIKGLEHIIKFTDMSKIRRILLFSSVAGVFGNAGQTDYAMANEAMNKFAHDFRYFFPETRITSINWGPWESGMITDTLKAFYEKHNIELIPVDKGADFCVKELRYGSHADSQIMITAAITMPRSDIRSRFPEEIQG